MESVIDAVEIWGEVLEEQLLYRRVTKAVWFGPCMEEKYPVYRSVLQTCFEKWRLI